MIGGNTTIQIQISTTQKNKIGEAVNTWETVQSIKGWMDFQTGNSNYNTFNTKIQESSHVFVSDYVALDNRIKAENSRVVDDKGLVYDVMLIDDPMELHEHLEIFLKFTGG